LAPANNGKRIRREKRTIEVMLGIYCRHHHDNDPHQLCDNCGQLLRYARQRLDNCVFGESKQPCNECAVQCYSPTLRTRIIEVMRYSGPRMTLRYPILGMRHFLDKLRTRF
jgi:hypothetical protein